MCLNFCAGFNGNDVLYNWLNQRTVTTTDFSAILEKDIYTGRYVFKDIFDVYSYIASKWNIGWYAAPQFQVMTLDDNRIVASPVPFTPLYRGQSCYYEKCLPSLYRKEWPPIQTLERLVQIEDFKTILNDNPAVQDFIKEGLIVNYVGLAQHYGIETNIIDLTNSFGVAAFFATSDYNSLTGCYRPVKEVIRKGVIYFLPMGMFTPTPQTDKNQIFPIGMDVLPRPGEQRGFCAYLEKGQDFNDVFGLNRFFFWHNEQASVECHRRMGFGMALFPYDPMVEKIWCMRKYRIYGKDSINKVLREHPEIGFDESVFKILIHAGWHIEDSTPFRYTQEELTFITDRYRKMYPGGFGPIS